MSNLSFRRHSWVLGFKSYYPVHFHSGDVVIGRVNYRDMLPLYFVPIEYYSSLVSLVQNILWFCDYFTWLFIIACDVWLTCKGICERHKALKPSHGFGGRYSAGQKRCAICALFIKWNGLWCPCCGCRLRTNPRNTEDRRRVRRKKVAIYLPNL